jgi:broad specificity phosphatase PhoE
VAKFVTESIPRDRITRLHLVRHGAVGDAWDDRVYGQMDVPLSAEGEAQAEALGKRMAGMSLDAVYASDLARARETARRVARTCGLTVRLLPALREASFGHWQGELWADILSRHADEVRARFANPADAKMKGGESLRDLKFRVMPAVEALVERHRGGSVAVVTHGGVTRVVIADALGMDLGSSFRLVQSHCCLNTLDYYPEGGVVRLVNG